MRQLISVNCILAVIFAASAAFSTDFEPLFVDDLEGWRELGGEWSMDEQGVVKGVAEPGGNVWLLYEKQAFWDCEIEFEFKTPAPTNGGLQFRSHWLPKAPVPEATKPADADHLMYGYQANVETRQRTGTGKLVDENGRGPLAETPLRAAMTLKQKDWNKMRVVARGDTIEVYLHDRLAHRTTDDKYLGGYLALQVFAFQMEEPATVLYRNLRVRDLGRVGDWRAIFDGESFEGWKEYGTEDWSIEDGKIVGRSGPKKSEGYLATKETWDDFRVRGQFKMLGEGNFGLFFHSSITLREKDGYPVIAGVQGEVEPGYPGTTGGLYESYQRGWLAKPEPDQMEAFALRPGQWNHIEIESEGNVRKTWVNGIRTVNFDDPEPRLSEGSFALQLHAGGVDGIAWKQMHVRDE